MKQYKAVFFLIFVFVSKVNSQELYLKMQLGECISCINGIDKIANYKAAKGKKYILFPEKYQLDSAGILSKYNIDTNSFKLIWNDSLFNFFYSPTNLSEVILVDDNLNIIDRKSLKELDKIPIIYDSFFLNTDEDREMKKNFYNSNDTTITFDSGNKNLCNLGVEGAAYIFKNGKVIYILNTISGNIIKKNLNDGEQKLICVTTESVKPIFNQLFADSASKIYTQFINDTKASPAYAPKIISAKVLNDKLYYIGNFYLVRNNIALPYYFLCIESNNESKIYPFELDSFFKELGVFSPSFLPISDDSLIINSFKLDGGIIANKPYDNTSSAGLYIKDKNQVFHFVKKSGLTFEGIYKEIGNNYNNILSDYPYLTYTYSNIVYDVSNLNNIKSYTLPLTFDFTKIKNLSDATIDGYLKYIVFQICSDYENPLNIYVLYGVTNSKNDRKIIFSFLFYNKQIYNI